MLVIDPVLALNMLRVFLNLRYLDWYQRYFNTNNISVNQKAILPRYEIVRSAFPKITAVCNAFKVNAELLNGSWILLSNQAGECYNFTHFKSHTFTLHMPNQ